MSHPAEKVTVAGLDPGPKPGTVLLAIDRDARSVTAHAGVPLCSLLSADFVAVERYVVQPRSGQVRDKGAQAETLVMAEEYAAKTRAEKGAKRLQYLGPGSVKPWATDRRLDRYGLLVKGQHHRDSVRHALYFAVRLGLLPRL